MAEADTTFQTEQEAERRRQIKLNQGAIHLIQSWIADEEGATEQAETWKYLQRALDEDRRSDRKLFP